MVCRIILRHAELALEAGSKRLASFGNFDTPFELMQYHSTNFLLLVLQHRLNIVA